MFRSYAVTEVEEMCGVSRRTISDYTAKGLLAGPSHRGRGARYPQSDIDVLQLLPKFRTLMKREFPNLNAVAAFLRQVSVHDLRVLAQKNSEASFILEVRRLRIRNYLAALAPHVAPERIEGILHSLTEGQIQAIDNGRYQIGSVVDISALLQEQPSPSTQTRTNGNVHLDLPPENDSAASWLNGSQSANVNGHYNGLGSDDVAELTAMLSRIEQKAASTSAELQDRFPTSQAQSERNFAGTRGDLPSRGKKDETSMTTVAAALGERLNEISQRLERLEAILEFE